jgi:GntR family transcriptional regulator/MocR family aminotransferase
MRRVSAAVFPPIRLESGTTAPLYRQLYTWFRTAILSGLIRPGQRIPSTRTLAAELQISRIPVLSAYEQLLTEGYLETFVGAGTCVARSIVVDTPGRSARRVGTRSRQTAVESGPRRLSKFGLTVARPQKQSWLSSLGAFRVSLPALDHFPITVWSRLVARHCRRPLRGIMAYGDAMGYRPLRETIAAYLGAARSVRCDSSQILVTTGSQQGLQIAAQVLLDAEDRVCIEEPGYPGAQQVFLAAGADLVPIPVDQDGIDVAEIIRRVPDARAVYITPSHQYPMGAAMSATRRMLLLSWAARSGAWIIEDDYDSEYRFGSRPIASLQGMDSDARVIYVGSFSKVMFPALRLGYVVIPKDLVAAFSAARETADIFSSTLYQAALTEFISEGHFARHIRRMRVLYAERRMVLVTEIQTQMGEALEVMGTEAGMHLVTMLPSDINDAAVSRQAAQKGISAMPLSTCCLRSPARGGLILGYGGANAQQLRDGVRKLRSCIESP